MPCNASRPTTKTSRTIRGHGPHVGGGGTRLFRAGPAWPLNGRESARDLRRRIFFPRFDHCDFNTYYIIVTFRFWFSDVGRTVMYPAAAADAETDAAAAAAVRWLPGDRPWRPVPVLPFCFSPLHPLVIRSCRWKTVFHFAFPTRVPTIKLLCLAQHIYSAHFAWTETMKTACSVPDGGGRPTSGTPVHPR